MAQYPIPQFIESEGKIISFLTFRQFFVLVGGGAFCFIFYYILPFFLFVIFLVITVPVVAMVAFLKVDGTSVVTIILNFLGFSINSKSYIWKKKESLYPFKIKVNQESKNIQEFGALEPKAKGLKDIKKIVELRKRS